MHNLSFTVHLFREGDPGDALYVIVALMWLVPDPRIESGLHDSA